jgi:hypothetical protein
MRYLLPVITSLLITLIASGCQKAGQPAGDGPVIQVQQIPGSGEAGQETRQLEPFTAIDVSVGDRLQIVQGDVDSITIEADGNVLPQLETVVHDKTLYLRWKASQGFRAEDRGPDGISVGSGEDKNTTVITINGKTYVAPASSNIQINDDQILLDGRPVVPDLENNSATIIAPTLPIVFRLTVTDLSQITSNGSTEINCDSLQAQLLQLTLNGSGNLAILNLTADNLVVKVAGSGDVSLGGKATNQNIRIDDSGDVHAAALTGTTANVSISGSGDAHVNVTNSLVVELEGSGNVTYSGAPELAVSADGSGKVEKAE